MEVETAKRGPQTYVIFFSGWCNEHQGALLQSSFGSCFYRQSLCHSLPLKNDQGTVFLEWILDHESESYLGM